MHAIFLTIISMGLVYFLAMRKRLDFFTVGYLSSTVYFLPGFVGHDLYHESLSYETYAVFIVVLVALAGSAVMNDALLRATPVSSMVGHPGTLARTAAVISLGVVALVVAIAGPTSLLLPKTEGAIPGGLQIAWRVTSSLAVVWAFLAGDKYALRIAVIALLLTFVAHDRTGLALTLIAVGTEFYRRKGSVTPLQAVRGTIVPVALLAALLFSGKLIHAAIQLSYSGVDLVRVSELVLSSGRLSSLFSRSEPFATQAILEGVVRSNFYVGPQHLLGVFYQIWPAPSMFGHDSGAFNALFQGQLFPNVRSASMAYNFWAEALASGGWLLLLIFVTMYVGGLALFNRLILAEGLGIKGLSLLLGSYWAFYIHRNSLGSIMTYERHIVYIACVVMVCAWLSRRLFAHGRVYPSGLPVQGNA